MGIIYFYSHSTNLIYAYRIKILLFVTLPIWGEAPTNGWLFVSLYILLVWGHAPKHNLLLKIWFYNSLSTISRLKTIHCPKQCFRSSQRNDKLLTISWSIQGSICAPLDIMFLQIIQSLFALCNVIAAFNYDTMKYNMILYLWIRWLTLPFKMQCYWFCSL